MNNVITCIDGLKIGQIYQISPYEVGTTRNWGRYCKVLPTHSYQLLANNVNISIYGRPQASSIVHVFFEDYSWESIDEHKLVAQILGDF